MSYRNLPSKLRTVLSSPGYAFKYLSAKLLNERIYYLFPESFSFLQEVTIFLTYECNLNCSFCSIKKKGLSSKKYLSLDTFKNFISQIKVYHPKILITGGEPFMVPSWEKYLNYLNEVGLNYSLFTNGTKISQVSCEILERVRRLKVSLDGPNSTVQDKIRGKGSFNKIIIGLEKIGRLKKDRRKKRPEIEICFTIVDKNYNYLLDMINLVKDLERKGIEIACLNFQHLFYVPEEIFEKSEGKFREFGFSPNKDLSFPSFPDYENIEVEYLAEEIKKIKDYRLSFPVYFFPDFKDEELLRFYKGEKINRYRNCIAPWTELILTPEGKVEICPDYEIGEVTQADFNLKSLSQSEKMRRLREFLKKDIFPFCYGCCHLYK